MFGGTSRRTVPVTHTCDRSERSARSGVKTGPDGRTDPMVDLVQRRLNPSSSDRRRAIARKAWKAWKVDVGERRCERRDDLDRRSRRQRTVANIEISSDLSALPRLVEFVEGFAEEHEVPPRIVMQLNLALEELVANVIQHGYADTPGKIRLTLERRESHVHASLIDAAPAYDPFSADEPELDAPVEHRTIGGLGVHLVREFADEFGYERRGNENQVRISIRL